MKSELTPLLTNISKLPIDTFQIDTKNDLITLNFDSTKNKNDISEIIFNDVTSFYYLDHEESVEDNEGTTVNTIMYCGDSLPDFIDFSEEEEYQVSVPNFVIELDASNMFIEAKGISINKQKFIV